jgi:hypothetical protein
MRFDAWHVTALALLTVCSTGTDPDRDSEREIEDAAVVVAWSKTAYDVAFAADSFRTFKGHRAFAMMHIAMHDAVNAVTPRYQPFAFDGRDAQADVVTAAAHAAHEVLLSQYPNAATTLNEALARTLAARPRGDASSRGVALGKQSAATILAAREGDGWNVTGTYAFRERVGAYQTTPPWNGFVLQPGFRHAKPFAITTPWQFRPAPPPALESAAYATAANEVKLTGSATSATRTSDQTGYAIWWMEFAEGSVVRLARRLTIERRLTIAEAARLFALMNMSLYDAYIAVWDSKFEYDHWRPRTAIRDASRDGNGDTQPDAAWEPLRPTPPFPEYVSGHAAGCAAAFTTLTRVLGDAGPFTMETITAQTGMPTRQFNHFDDAASECADSRVRLGWHFRYATDAGLAIGRAVASYVAEHRLTGTGNRELAP